MDKRLMWVMGIAAALIAAFLLPRIFKNRDFVEVTVNGQQQALAKLQQRDTLTAYTTSSRGMLGVVGLILVVEDGEDDGEAGRTFDRTSSIPQFRPSADQLLVEPLDKTLYEGRISNSLSADSGYTHFSSTLSGNQIAEIVIKDEVFFGFREVEKIPYDRLKNFIRSQAQPGKRYLFVENATLTSTVYRTFDEAEGSGAYSGTIFKANGKTYASNKGYAYESTLSVQVFDLALLEAGEAGSSEDEAVRQLLIQQANGELGREDAKKLLNLLKSGTRRLGQPKLERKLDLKDIDAAARQISAKDLSLPRNKSLRYDVRVAGTVPRLRQPSHRTCWATVATMLGSWKAEVPLSIEQYLAGVDQAYLKLFQKDRPLRRVEKEHFLKSAGLDFQWGQSFHPDGLEKLLRNYGPVWFTVTLDNEFSKHATLVVAMYGTGDMKSTYVVFIDPNDGSEHAMLYGVFMKRYEDVAFTQNLERDRLESYQVVHFP